MKHQLHFDEDTFAAWANRRAEDHFKGQMPLHERVRVFGSCPWLGDLSKLLDHGFVVDCAPLWSRGVLDGHEFAVISRTYCSDAEIDHPPVGLKTYRLPAEVLGCDPGTAIATVLDGPGPMADQFLVAVSCLPVEYFACVLSSHMDEAGYAVLLKPNPALSLPGACGMYSIPRLVGPSSNFMTRAKAA